MFFYLNELLSGIPFFQWLQYALVRSGFAFLTAFLISVFAGPAFIAMLRRRKLGENAQNKDAEWLAKAHASKSGTPTMGGVLMVLTLLATTLLWCRFDVFYTWLAVVVLLQLALVGIHDDWMKLNKHKMGEGIAESRVGLRGIDKLILQCVIGGTVGIALYLFGDRTIATTLFIPMVNPATFAPVLGIGFVLLAILVVTATSNAVNLTDGLDGLAIGNSLIVLTTFGLLAYLAGNSEYAQFLNIVHVAGAEELTIVSAAMIGAGMGFLWFNSHPAQVFMGDTGALAVGGMIATIALVIKMELILVIVGGVFVAEAFSVILQVTGFKLFKKRVFLCAPLHHHLERKGWPENKIVTRFWIIGVILAIAGLMLLKI